mmetsp:Transcript_10805/g.37524  ORF Transcript_10805/g.37524 Transcript_10805/m.37524 type:complete len:423 (-) Transcript_10805:1325-2593(-)
MREVAIMKKLDHPNVVSLYEVIDDPSGPFLFLVLEYVESGPILRNSGNMQHIAEPVARQYFREIVKGLDYLHFNKVIHRDLKPENLLKSADGTIKISDFGVSELFDNSDTLKRTAGTPAFLAPEVCTGEAFQGKPADIWALGVVLYSFVFGRTPFMADTVILMFEAITKVPLVFPTKVLISDELMDLLTRILTKDAEERIKLPEIMVHPWVTDKGVQPMESPYEILDGVKPVSVTAKEVSMAVKREEMISMLRPILKKQSFAPGNYIIRQGEIGNSMYFIESGECEVLLEAQNSRIIANEEDYSDDDEVDDAVGGCTEQTKSKTNSEQEHLDVFPQIVAVRDAGQFFGEMAVFGEQQESRRTASVRARTQVDLLVVTKDEVLKILQNQPEATEEIKRTIARRRSDTIVHEVMAKVTATKSSI